MSNLLENLAATKLVVFDVDGTLYKQRPVRLRMARDIIIHCCKQLSLSSLSVIKNYRQYREYLGDTEFEKIVNNLVDNDQVSEQLLEDKVVQYVSYKTGISRDVVYDIVQDWINTRPLKYLIGARYKGVKSFFDFCRENSIKIGIFSDYPAEKKIKALGLFADYIISANDVNALKPNPKGLLQLMSMANIAPDKTIMIGDRPERDGAAAQKAHVLPMIFAEKVSSQQQSFNEIDGCYFFTQYLELLSAFATARNVQ